MFQIFIVYYIKILLFGGMLVMDIKLDTVNEKEITAQAVVIGCSHNNSECAHERHPSKDAFFTIDILPELEPDLCMDITKDAVPDYLKNKFQLTILEFLPFDAYNLSKASEIDGVMGWHHIKELTHDDGFIMAVGNTSSFCFRSSLANVKFLELAHSEQLEVSVILISKNQNLTASEVKEQIQYLPQELQDSIQISITTQGFTPSQANDFCKRNYAPSEVNAELIDALNLYSCLILRTPPDHPCYDELCEHKHAADALIEVLLGNAPESSLEVHQSVLTSDPLGPVIEMGLKGRLISELINKVDNAEPFYTFKEKYAGIKQQDEESIDQSFYPGM
jgi:hypothetical protein